MTARRSRRTWTDEERLRAIAHARQFGPSSAAREFGMPVGTVKSWVARAGDDASEVEAAAGDLLEREQRTGALDDGELGSLHREAADAMTAALKRGDALSAQRLATAVGVLEDKVTRRREAPRSAAGDSTEHVTDVEARERLASHIQGVIGHLAGTAMRELVKADDSQLDAEIRRRYVFIAGLEREVRWLHEERQRRRLGEPSLFGAMQDVQLNGPEARAWRGESEPVPVPLVLAPLEGAISEEPRWKRQEAIEAKRDNLDERTAKAQFRRRHRHTDWAGPRRGIDARFDHPPSGAA